jgi:hypothetical protein
MSDDKDSKPGLALRIGIAGALGIGAVVSGLVISRQGRRLMREAWQGRRRTRIEDRVLDAIWGDPVLGRRDIDVAELGPGVVALGGSVATQVERRRLLRVARAVRDVNEVEDRLALEPKLPRRRRQYEDDDADD